jgi:hypothetical protein
MFIVVSVGCGFYNRSPLTLDMYRVSESRSKQVGVGGGEAAWHMVAPVAPCEGLEQSMIVNKLDGD